MTDTKRWFLGVILWSFVILSGYEGRAESQYVSPPNQDTPTEVEIVLYVLDILSIDTPSQTFEVKAFIDLKWKDERLAFDPKEIGIESKIFEDAGAKQKLIEIWWPDINIVNEHGPPVIDNRELIIAADGTVEYKLLIEVQLFFRPDLAQFPFDIQTFPIKIQSFSFDETILVFKMHEKATYLSNDLYLNEWDLVASHAEIVRRQELRSDKKLSEFLLTITLRRKPHFYIWKIFAPLMLILMVSWSIFWMSDEPLSSRVNIAIVGLLTAVAFSFVFLGHLPRVSYLTFMDVIVTGTYFFLVLNVVEDVLEEIIKRYGREKWANRFNVTCLVLFILAYIMMWMISLLSFGIWTL